MEMLHAGITVEACLDCSENFRVKERIEKLGINVRYMGIPLTEYIKNGEKTISV